MNRVSGAMVSAFIASAVDGETKNWYLLLFC